MVTQLVQPQLGRETNRWFFVCGITGAFQMAFQVSRPRDKSPRILFLTHFRHFLFQVFPRVIHESNCEYAACDSFSVVPEAMRVAG